MKTKCLPLMIVLLLAALLCATSSCVNQNYLMFDDDEWSGSAIDSDRSLTNSELEMDDWDR